MQYRVVAALLFSISLVAALYVVINNKKVDLKTAGGQTSVAEQKKLEESTRAKIPFESAESIKEKKRGFFNFLITHVLAENMELLQQRQRVSTLKSIYVSSAGFSLEQQDEFDQFLIKYKLSASQMDPDTLFAELLMRVDIIPTSLALSQAANESAWGTSRFAKDANNYFGQWCFKKGCGLVPSLRPEGEIYEVARFSSVRKSVSSYFRNINTHAAYEMLREIRAKLRSENKVIKGELLADGLIHYSERGEEYVNELKAMIRVNDLAKWDEQLTHAASDYARQPESTGMRTSENALLR